MSSNVRALLDELYKLHPDLQSQEAHIIHIIETMLDHRPKVAIDEWFRTELRCKILSELSQQQNDSRSNFIFPTWLFSAFGTAFASVIIGVFVFYTFFPYTKLWYLTDGARTRGWLVSFVPAVEKISDHAFQIFTPLPNTQAKMGVASVPMSSDSMSSKIRASSLAPTREVDVPQYAFTGSLPPLTEKLNIYRKKIQFHESFQTEDFLNGLNLKGIKLSSLQDANISNLTITESWAYGYIVTIDSTLGSISFNPNYDTWPPYPKCNGDWCDAPTPITQEQIPSPTKLQSIADTFLDTYGIDRTLYGVPSIDTSWDPESGVEWGGENLPEVLTVIYPLLLEWKEIFEEYGSVRGLSLTYDLRSGKITNLSGLERLSLESSKYSPIQDEMTLKNLISNHGDLAPPPISPELRWSDISHTSTGISQPQAISLSSPMIAFVHLTRMNQQGAYEEYFVPAYVFSIPTIPGNPTHPKKIIIPVIKEFIPDVRTK